jgi:succinate-semialdehyde dehydrogenase/glutarate-semialdehyde dehydrogenase
MAIATREPSTGRLVKEYTEPSAVELDAALDAATVAARALRRSALGERVAALRRVASVLDSDLERFASLITIEMGRPLGAARAEIAKCATSLRYYAEHAAEFMAPVIGDAAAVGASRAEVRWDPLGVVLAVMPWNYPFWQVIRFAAPALLAGNSVLLKHASNVPQCALALQEVFERAGFPDGAFQSLLVGSDRVADLIRDPRVAAITLTGSESAGRQVASVAGSVIKKCVLELGGSDPFIVMPSSDVARAGAVAAQSRTQNSGQSCISAKRFIVHTDIADEFIDSFVSAMSAVVTGDPWDATTTMGPLATPGGLGDIRGLVDDALSHGASVLLGADEPESGGWFYNPTVLRGVTPSARIFAEEAFGPVATVLEVGDLEEAIRIANSTDFGLSSSVWTRDPDEFERFALELDAGGVFLNGMTASYPQLPFGGIKSSGYGRELSYFGLREFCNAKTVWVGAEPTESVLF